MRDLFIKCSNEKERDQVLNVLHKEQYQPVNGSKKGLNVSTLYRSKEYTLRESNLGRTEITFNQFMEKYAMNEMREKINQVKSKLKINDTELSLLLGKSRQYIGKMLRITQSEKVQKSVISEIDEVLLEYKTIGLIDPKAPTIIEAETPQVKQLKDDIHKLCNEKIDLNASLKFKTEHIDKLLVINNGKDAEISSLIIEKNLLNNDLKKSVDSEADWKDQYIKTKNDCADKIVRLHVLYLLVIAFLSGLIIVSKFS